MSWSKIPRKQPEAKVNCQFSSGECNPREIGVPFQSITQNTEVIFIRLECHQRGKGRDLSICHLRFSLITYYPKVHEFPHTSLYVQSPLNSHEHVSNIMLHKGTVVEGRVTPHRARSTSRKETKSGMKLQVCVSDRLIV